MGGETWTQTGPYPDPAAAFRQAQETSLAALDPRFGFADRPLEDLWRDPAWHEFIFTGGTATVLDFPHTIDATDHDDGPYMRPLTEAETRAWSPTGRPTEQDWEAALDSGRLNHPARAQGNCVTLYYNGHPTKTAYWGTTAD
ncbi:hypothetical protein [Streptomyces sp. NPDC097619]|uniref:hypothetical protein n=1 Tax=Streptomyces sp. NPDC097619 TaxID=3157228 RepID=UPI003322D4B9